MKLLFDQNISYRILKKLKDTFPNSGQVRRLNLENRTDQQIWKFAKSNNYTIVTFDGDFCDLSILKGHPPKIIWIRTGNLDTNDLAKLLIRKSELISDFINLEKYSDWACLEIK